MYGSVKDACMHGSLNTVVNKGHDENKNIAANILHISANTLNLPQL